MSDMTDTNTDHGGAVARRVRHLKRGTEYAVIGEARLQQASQFGPVEGDLVTFYRGDDGQFWARATSEFEDGRFEDVALHPAPQADTDARERVVDWSALSDLHTIKGWLHGLATNPDLNDVVADGGVTVGDCYQQEAREFAGRLDRILAALKTGDA